MGGKIILNGKEYASSTPGGGASSFADLDDVDLTFLQDGEFPQYNSLTQKWENVTLTKVNDVKVNGTSVVNSNLVANIKSYKEVTQAEYEALPASKTSDGIAYFITDAVEAEGYPPLIYSLQEREVGVWIDGRPLYQIVLKYTDTTINDWVAKDIHELNIDKIAFMCGTYTRISSVGRYVYLFDSREAGHSANGSGTFRIDSENGYSYGRLLYKIVFEATDEQTFILQYTKTTDTPGQGIWAGNGAMAHHYSTDEVIVGTWIDGKPLYELTLYTAGPSSIFSIDLTDYNINLITNMHGMYTVNGDQVTLPLSHTNGFADQSFLRYNSDKTLLFAFGSYQTPASNIIATLQYTKTTD